MRARRHQPLVCLDIFCPFPLPAEAFYCKRCELMYHGEPACPQCGRAPAKPPKSIFTPPPVDTTGELLVEAERNGERNGYSLEEKIRTWFACLATAKKRNGTIKVLILKANRP